VVDPIKSTDKWRGRLFSNSLGLAEHNPFASYSIEPCAPVVLPHSRPCTQRLPIVRSRVSDDRVTLIRAFDGIRIRLLICIYVARCIVSPRAPSIEGLLRETSSPLLCSLAANSFGRSVVSVFHSKALLFVRTRLLASRFALVPEEVAVRRPMKFVCSSSANSFE